MKQKYLTIPASLLLAVLIGFIDYQSGSALSFSPFYLLPISLMAWTTGTWGGIIGSLVCTAIWLIADASHPDLDLQKTVLFWNTTARVINFFVVGTLVAQLKNELIKQTEMAQMDGKTNALNFRAFQNLLSKEISRSLRFGHPFTVVFFDLDNFKVLNDQFGHLTGDKVLHCIVEVCKRVTRQTDEVGRVGGDEFMILLPETGKEEAEHIVDRLRTELHDEMNRSGWPVTLSIGLLTVMDASHYSIDHILEAVDHLQYEAKKNGKNSIVSHAIP